MCGTTKKNKEKNLILKYELTQLLFLEFRKSKSHIKIVHSHFSIAKSELLKVIQVYHLRISNNLNTLYVYSFKL